MRRSVVAAMIVALACEKRYAAVVQVELTTDIAEATWIELRTRSQDGARVTGAGQRQWPAGTTQTFNLVPREDDLAANPDAVFEVVAASCGPEGSRIPARCVLVAQRARVRYREGVVRIYRMQQSASCRGVVCGDGQTCRDGACADERAEVPSSAADAGGTSPLRDAGVDSTPFFDATLIPDGRQVPDVTSVPDVRTETGVGTDGGVGCVPNESGPSRSFDFVIHQFEVDRNSTPSATAPPTFGFDLDGVRSPTSRPPEGAPHCAHGDFRSSLDPDQNADAQGRPCVANSSDCVGGVDNQMPALNDALGQFTAGFDVGRELTARTRSGRSVFAVRVSDVNGAPGPALCDPSVTIRLYRVIPLFSDCAGVPNPGQRYAITASSLTDRSNPDSAIGTFPGRIVNGRVRVEARRSMEARPVPFVPMWFIARVGEVSRYYNAQIALTLNADGSGRSGNFGGFILKRDLLADLARVPELAPFLAAAAPLLGGFSDIATPLGTPGALCIGQGLSGSEEGGIGIGLGLSMVPAEITRSVVDAPSVGACGYVAPDGGL